MTLEEMMKAVLLSAKAAADGEVDDGEVEVEHEAVSTYAADDVTVTVYTNLETHALKKLVVNDSVCDSLILEGDDVHSFITVMARVLKGMTSKQP